LTPAEWFASACASENPAFAVDPTLLTQAAPLAAIPSLVQILTLSNEWYLRTNALRYLESATGRSFGAVDRNTTADERRRIAAEFQKVYEGVKQ
jgi:hypothetical protein